MYVLLFLLAGIGAGFVFRFRGGALPLASRATCWALCLLIFLLGASMGANETVVRALGQLGAQALVLSTGAVGGSVLVSWLVSRMFFKGAPHEK
jgi:uncharacterized membrane protein YbjE (DUF340 family)